jgi:exosortase family protein XrtF
VNNPFYRFILLFLVIYAGWYGLYEFLIQPNGTFDEWIIATIVQHSRWIFDVFGVVLSELQPGLHPSNWLAIEGSSGVIIGPSCNGLALFALFLAFMLSFPGPIKHKVWYVPLGMLLIHAVNLLRVVALVLIVKWNESWLEFNHDYTFTILVYLFVFALWYIWINRFSPVKSLRDEAK